MDMMFENAIRSKMRFESSRGLVSVEDLWDVPLRSTDDFNLNEIAKKVNESLKSASEESFVDIAKDSPAKKLLEKKLEVIKHVIEVKLAEEAEAKTKAANRVEREKLLKILAEKQAGELSDLSVKELKKRIEALE